MNRLPTQKRLKIHQLPVSKPLTPFRAKPTIYEPKQSTEMHRS